MLTGDDISYIAGALSNPGKPDAVKIDFETATHPDAAKSTRHSGVIITGTNDDGSHSAYAGIEAGDHHRKLDVFHVEHLIKWARSLHKGVPRSIVSASGFTPTAIKKAARHHVALYELKEWNPGETHPGFKPPATEEVASGFQWLGAPCCEVTPETVLPEYEAVRLLESNPDVLVEEMPDVAAVPLKTWTARFANVAAEKFQLRDESQTGDSAGGNPAMIRLVFSGRPYVQGRAKVYIRNLEVSGVVERSKKSVEFPAVFKALFPLGNTSPKAGCGLLDKGDKGLFAIVVSENGKWSEVPLIQIEAARKNAKVVPA
jgi:hypothetical protein